MSEIDLSRGGHDALPVANRDVILSRYHRLRTAGRGLNDRLVQRLPKDALQEGGKKLGVLRDGTLIFDTEDEMSVLMEYCIYDVRRNGRNVIEQYLIDSPPDPESDEMACLQAMKHAIYSLFVVESVERGLGVTVRDLISKKVYLLVDLGFGSTAQTGLVFASRLLHLDGFSITGGAALPISVVPADQLDDFKSKLPVAAKPLEEECFDPAQLIRSCLSAGSSSHVRYQETSGKAIRQQRTPKDIRSVTSRRNSPCPCGSGKKYRQCCFKNR